MVITAVLVASVAVAAPAEPEQAATPPASAAPAEAPETSGAAGLLVVVDPETGEIVDEPTPEQLAAAAARLLPSSAPSLKRSDAGLEPFPLATGGRGVFLDGRFQTATVLRVATDGSFHLECVDSPEEAALLLAQPPPAPAQQPDGQWEEK